MAEEYAREQFTGSFFPGNTEAEDVEMRHIWAKEFMDGARALAKHPSVIAMREALDSLGAYACAIQKNHPEECAHGHGYSLLGQFAQQVGSDAHYALEAFDKLIGEVGE